MVKMLTKEEIKALMFDAAREIGWTEGYYLHDQHGSLRMSILALDLHFRGITTQMLCEMFPEDPFECNTHEDGVINLVVSYTKRLNAADDIPNYRVGPLIKESQAVLMKR